MSGPWACWDGPMDYIDIDATEFPTLGAAMREAKMWVVETGGGLVRAKGSRKSMRAEHDKCEEGYCCGQMKGCITDHLVWRIALEDTP